MKQRNRIKNTPVLLVGGVIAGIVLWMQAKTIEVTVPARVVAVQQVEADVQITALVEDVEVTLAPRAATGTYRAGDAICVDVTSAPNAQPTYELAASDVRC